MKKYILILLVSTVVSGFSVSCKNCKYCKEVKSQGEVQVSETELVEYCGDDLSEVENKKRSEFVDQEGEIVEYSYKYECN